MTSGPAYVRWGFLGAGTVARLALAPAVHAADGALLQHVAARDPERARALGPGRVSTDYEAVLADPDVDIVYIALSNEAHLPWTLAALAAGKHVLCEKPLGLTAGEVDAMAYAAGQAGRQVVEASWYRWHPRVRLAQQRLPEIGPVEHVSAGFTYDGALEGYRLDVARGGGALYDVGCYAVSACLWAVQCGLPLEVTARSTYGVTGVDLDTSVILDWDGATAEVRAAISGAPERQWLVLTGRQGEIELRDKAFTAWHSDATELWVSDGAGTERVPVPATDPYRLMVEELSSRLTGGPGWGLPVQQSRQTAAVLDAARASAAAGGVPVRPF